jgi:hypothetical protein
MTDSIHHNKHTLVHWLSQLLEVHTPPVPRIHSSHTYSQRSIGYHHTPSSGEIVKTKRSWVCYSVWHQCIIYILSTSLSLGHDLPPLHLVCERLQSLQTLTLCLSENRHLLPSSPLSLHFIRYNKHRDQDLYSLFLYRYTRDLVFWIGRQSNRLQEGSKSTFNQGQNVTEFDTHSVVSDTTRMTKFSYWTRVLVVNGEFLLPPKRFFSITPHEKGIREREEQSVGFRRTQD